MTPFSFTGALSLPFLLIPLLAGTAEVRLPRAAAALHESQKTAALTAEVLTGRSFRFSWKRDAAGGFNGLMVLSEGGRIEGINSPNETSWKLDEENRLLILHEDGPISTTFESCTLEDGKYRFERPFHFRERIVHFLEETDEKPRQPVPFDEGLPECLLHTGQTIVCLDIGEEYVYELSSGERIPIKLKSVEVTGDSVVGLVRSAEVVVEVLWEADRLRCAPYVMPPVFNRRVPRRAPRSSTPGLARHQSAQSRRRMGRFRTRRQLQTTLGDCASGWHQPEY